MLIWWWHVYNTKTSYFLWTLCNIIYVWTPDGGDTQAIHKGHLAHRPHGEGAKNEVSDDRVELNVEEGGMLANPASSCSFISRLSHSTMDLITICANTTVLPTSSKKSVMSKKSRDFEDVIFLEKNIQKTDLMFFRKIATQ